jgi:DNA-directed RNA polymerase subunit RPC12/RpoP
MRCTNCSKKLDFFQSLRSLFNWEEPQLCAKCKLWDFDASLRRFSVKKQDFNVFLLCQDCNTEYQVKEHDSRTCPYCSSRYWTLLVKEDSSATSILNDPSIVSPEISSFNSNYSFEGMVLAQNRTTHAVRAFVRFLFIQLTGITFAVFLWNLSTAAIDQRSCFVNGTKCSANESLQTLAALVWIVAVVWSSWAGWSELDKSKVN